MPTQFELWKLFTLFDTNKDGALERDELKAILCRDGSGRPFSGQDADEFIAQFDEDGDGKISIEEFCKACSTVDDPSAFDNAIQRAKASEEAKVTLTCVSVSSGKVRISVRPSDKLASVKTALQDQIGTPPTHQVTLFYAARDDADGVVFATQIRGLVDAAAFEEMSRLALRLWAPDDDVAALGLQSGARVFYTLSLREGTPPLLDEAQTAMQNQTALERILSSGSAGALELARALWDEGVTSTVAGAARRLHLIAKLMPMQVDSDPVRKFMGHRGAVAALAFTPDGARLVTGDDDSNVRVWDCRSGEQLQQIDYPTDEWDADGERVHHWVMAVAITPDNTRVVAGLRSKQVRVSSLSDGSTVHELVGHVDEVSGVAVTPDGQHIISCSHDSTVRVWAMADGGAVRTINTPDFVMSMALTPNGQHVLCGLADDTIRVWSLADGAEVRVISGETADRAYRRSEVRTIAVSPDGKLIASAAALHVERTVKIWRLDDGELVLTLSGHMDFVNEVSFSPDGKLLASASNDHSLRVWSVSDGTLLQDVRMPSYTHAVRFSVDGLQIVTGHGAKGSFDKGVYAWAAPT